MRLVDGSPPPQRRRHDYNAILDGKTWELIRGEDYDCSTKSMRNMLYAEAANRKGTASIQPIARKDGREGLHVTFCPLESTG